MKSPAIFPITIEEESPSLSTSLPSTKPSKEKPFERTYQLDVDLHAWMIIDPYYTWVDTPPFSWIAMLLNNLIQGTLIFYLYYIIETKQSPLLPINLSLPLALIAIFVMTIFSTGDFFQSIFILIYLLGFNYQKKRERFRFTEDGELVTGIQLSWVLFYVFIGLIPKVVIGMLHYIVGLSYILHSTDNESLFLNALSVMFITDLDNIGFALFANKNINKFIEEMPGYNEERIAKKGLLMRTLWKLIHEFGKITIVIIYLLSAFFYGCKDRLF